MFSAHYLGVIRQDYFDLLLLPHRRRRNQFHLRHHLRHPRHNQSRPRDHNRNLQFLLVHNTPHSLRSNQHRLPHHPQRHNVDDQVHQARGHFCWPLRRPQFLPHVVPQRVR